jgi:uncharacterized protein (TIGR04551 family)
MVAAALSLASVPRLARATGFTDYGQDHEPRDTTTVKLDGYMRLRGELLENLDLDRGLTPSGKPLFPVPLGDPNAQTLPYADMRFRTDVAMYAPGTSVAVKARFDVLDDYPLGGNPAGIPSASTTQLSPASAFRVKRAYGEALTPLGLLAAGRMGNQWGMGLLANGGDCDDCDSGDAADRIAFVSPLGGHLFAAAYDLTAIGPTVPRPDGTRSLVVEPSANVNTVTFAALRYHDDFARARRRRADKPTIEYGAYVSHRWQRDDVPATHLPTAQPIPIDASQVMARGYQATAFDGWVRFTHPMFHVEAEGAFLTAQVDQPSLIPGVLYHVPVTSTQFGGALQSEVGAPEHRAGIGLDAGYASGDPSPGMRAPAIGAQVPQPGEIEGPVANPPFKNSIDNFRFHPDFRVDQILFREIIGTVTNAIYVRPHARYDLVRSAPAILRASVSAVQSWAVYAEATPGGQHPLGVEVDPTLAYFTRDGFGAALEYAVLFPFSAFDNPAAHLGAKPAQLIRLRLMYRF